MNHPVEVKNVSMNHPVEVYKELMKHPVEVQKVYMKHPVEESLRIPDQVSLCQGVLKSKPIIQYTIDDVF